MKLLAAITCLLTLNLEAQLSIFKTPSLSNQLYFQYAAAKAQVDYSPRAWKYTGGGFPVYPESTDNIVWNTKTLLHRNGVLATGASAVSISRMGYWGQGACVALTPRHVLTSGHMMYPGYPTANGNNAWILFIGQNNVGHTNRIIALHNLIGQNGPDRAIALLESNLPPFIQPMRVLGTAASPGFPNFSGNVVPASYSGVSSTFGNPWTLNSEYLFTYICQYNFVHGYYPQCVESARDICGPDYYTPQGQLVDRPDCPPGKGPHATGAGNPQTAIAGDSGSPVYVILNNECLYLYSISTYTWSPTSTPQSAMDELSVGAGLDPALYQMKFYNPGKYQ